MWYTSKRVTRSLPLLSPRARDIEINEEGANAFVEIGANRSTIFREKSCTSIRRSFNEGKKKEKESARRFDYDSKLLFETKIDLGEVERSSMLLKAPTRKTSGGTRRSFLSSRKNV